MASPPRILRIAALLLALAAACDAFGTGGQYEKCDDIDDCFPGYFCATGAAVTHPYCVDACAPSEPERTCPPAFACVVEGFIAPACLRLCEDDDDCLDDDLVCRPIDDRRVCVRQ